MAGDVDDEHLNFLLDEIDREMQNEMQTVRAQSKLNLIMLLIILLKWKFSVV